jgi:hypothetical protein
LTINLKSDKINELGAGSWELGAGSWELGAGSWELGAGSWELGAGSREPGAKPNKTKQTNHFLLYNLQCTVYNLQLFQFL